MVPMKNLSVLLLVTVAGLARAGAPETVPVGNPGNRADTAAVFATAW